MLSGILVGVLTEQHADHIVLDDSFRIPLPNGLPVQRFGSGAHVTVVYGYDDRGWPVVESIKRSALFKREPMSWTRRQAIRNVVMFGKSPRG
jgi:hypothetical protein